MVRRKLRGHPFAVAVQGARFPATQEVTEREEASLESARVCDGRECIDRTSAQLSSSAPQNIAQTNHTLPLWTPSEASHSLLARRRPFLPERATQHKHR